MGFWNTLLNKAGDINRFVHKAGNIIQHLPSSIGSALGKGVGAITGNKNLGKGSKQVSEKFLEKVFSPIPYQNFGKQVNEISDLVGNGIDYLKDYIDE